MTYGPEELRPPARRGYRGLRPGGISIQLPADAELKTALDKIYWAP